jgi:hypothetical protein
VSAGYFQKAVAGESGMIRTEMGMHNRSEMVAMYGKPCVIPSHNSNSILIIMFLFFETHDDPLGEVACKKLVNNHKCLKHVKCYIG